MKFRITKSSDDLRPIVKYKTFSSLDELIQFYMDIPYDLILTNYGDELALEIYDANRE